MDQESSQAAAATGSHSGLSDQPTSRRMRSNSVRDHSGSEREDRHRSRRSSVSRSNANVEASQYNRAQEPINEAVKSALKPTVSNQPSLPPELISQLTSQITASVLQQLQTSQHSPPVSQSTTGSVQHAGVNSTGASPPLDRGTLHTPPSPWRASEEAAQTGMPTSPGKLPKSSSPPNLTRPLSPPFSHSAMSDDNDAKEGISTRPELERSSTGGDATIVEKIWGKLFDEQGQVTTRLSQFLRGIAVHLIEDYEPKHSLVISPQKMQKYYEATKLPAEIYPWQVIFDDRTSSISRMFREVQVQHHLTQECPSERPDIPGLTPIGFETWMTLVLKAHPDEEFERLAYTALHMPVSNPDDRRERFPKELSRRQFPKEADGTTASKLQKIMLTHCGVKVSHRSHAGSDNESRPAQTTQTKTHEPASSSDHIPQSQHLSSATDYNLSRVSTRSDRPSVSEPDRSHLQPTVTDAVSEDGEERPIPSKPIERERKPYSVAPGGGKCYDHTDNPTQPDAKFSYPTPQPNNTRLGRSSSLNGRPGESKHRPAPISIHQKSGQQNIQPIDIPPPQRPRAGSTHQREGSRGDRNRSPSISRSSEHPQRSDGDLNYGSYHSNNPADYASGSFRPERQANDRHEPRVSFSSEVKDREPRQRYQSVSSADDQRYYYSGDPYRSGNPNHAGSDAGYPSQQYPPTSYRSRA